MSSNSEQTSRYRRIQRFFAEFSIDFDMIAGFIFKLFFTSGGTWYLTMDRTNWQWGKSDINILTLAVVFKGIAIPIYWELLDKRGNSDTAERIALIQRFIKRFGKGCIAGILADREFIAGGYSIADIACYPWIVPHEKQGQNLDDFPNIKRWMQIMKERKAVQRAYGLVEKINPNPEINDAAKKILFGQNAKVLDDHIKQK